MTIEQLKAAVAKKPFQPFTLRMAGGGSHRVPSPEFVWVPPTNQRTFIVYEENAFHIIDLLLVESIRVEQGVARRRRTG